MAQEHFIELAEVQVCDTNEVYLVPVISLNLKVHKVPPVVSPEYLKYDCSLINCIMMLCKH